MSYNDFGRRLRDNLQAFPNNFFKIGEGLNGSTISDQEAIQRGYLGSAVVYTIVKRISVAISNLPIYIYDKNTGEEITSGDVYDFVYKPNDFQSFNEFWEQLVTFYELTGEGYIYNDVDSVGFMGGRQVILPPQNVEINNYDSSILSNVQSYDFNNALFVKKIDPEFVMHVAMNNPTITGLQDKNGLSPLQAAQNILNASNNIEIALSEYFQNRGVSALVSASGDAGQSMQPKDQTFLQKALNRVIGGADKMNSVHVIKTPVTVQQLNASSTDMQTIENKTQLIRELSAVWGLPSVLVNDNATATYNNVKEAKKEAYSELYIPTFYKIAAAYERKFLSQFGDYCLGVKISKIDALNPTPTERRKEAREDVKAGIITPNEARAEIGLEEINEPAMNVASATAKQTTQNER